MKADGGNICAEENAAFFFFFALRCCDDMTVDHGENHDDDVGLVQVSLGLSEYMTGQGEEGPAPRLVASSFFFSSGIRGMLGVWGCGKPVHSIVHSSVCIVVLLFE